MIVRNITARDLEVTPDEHPSFTVLSGDTAEVPDDLGARMVEQVDVWAKPSKSDKKES